MRPTLEQLYREHQGKVSDKWQLYLTEYERLLAPWREREVRLLEIGVQNGGSLEIWGKYFSKAQKIIGVDINPECAKLKYDDPRITVLVGDANQPDCAQKIFAQSNEFNLIIDDGSHRSGDIVKSFALYFNQLTEDGLYIAEDLHSSYWREFQGGLYAPFASVAFFKRLADIVNYEHWGVHKHRMDVLGGFTKQYGVFIDDVALGQIHSVEFANSICVIKKLAAQKNSLGTRTVAGHEAAVLAKILDVPRTRMQFDQSGNEWSIRTIAPDEELPERLAEVQRLSADQAALQASLSQTQQNFGQAQKVNAELGATISGLQQQTEQQRQINRQSQEVNAALRQTITALQQQTEQQRQELDRQRQTNRQSQEANTALQQKISGLQQQAEQQRQELERQQQINRQSQEASVVLQQKITGLQQQTEQRRQEIERLNQNTVRLQKAADYLQMVVNSAHAWQKRSWFKRAFHRWRSPEQITQHPGLLQRLNNSLRKRLGRLSPAVTSQPNPSVVALASKKKPSPRVSVIIPSYNHAKYLKQCLDSVLAQTFQDFEIIVVDDHSTDNSAEILRQFKDSRLRVTISPVNRGQYYSINRALETASGEYIAILNSDDYWHPDKLEKQVRFLEQHKNIGAVFTRVNVVGEEGQPRAGYDIFDRSPNKSRFQWLQGFFYCRNYLCHPSVLIRAECHRTLGGYQESFFSIADIEFWTRLCFRYEIHIMDEKLTYFRIRDGEANGSGNNLPNYNRIFFEQMHVIDDFVVEIKNLEVLKAIFPDLSIQPGDEDLIPCHLANLAMVCDDPKLARPLYLWALQTLKKMLDDKRLAQRLEKRFAFGTADLIRMAGMSGFFTPNDMMTRHLLVPETWKRLLLVKLAPQKYFRAYLETRKK